MIPFTNPREATSYVLDRIFEQAAIDGVTFTDVERKLLSGLVVEREIEAFEDRDEGEEAAKLWRKLEILLRHSLQRVEQYRDRELQREYKTALKIAAADSSYTAQILKALADSRLSTRFKRHLRRWAVLAPICLFAGVGLAAALFWIFPAVESFKKTSVGKMLEQHGSIVIFVILLCVALLPTVWWKWRLRRWESR